VNRIGDAHPPDFPAGGGPRIPTMAGDRVGARALDPVILSKDAAREIHVLLHPHCVAHLLDTHNCHCTPNSAFLLLLLPFWGLLGKGICQLVLG